MLKTRGSDARSGARQVTSDDYLFYGIFAGVLSVAIFAAPSLIVVRRLGRWQVLREGAADSEPEDESEGPEGGSEAGSEAGGSEGGPEGRPSGENGAAAEEEGADADPLAPRRSAVLHPAAAGAGRKGGGVGEGGDDDSGENERPLPKRTESVTEAQKDSRALLPGMTTRRGEESP